MKLGVVGGGAWGTALAQVAATGGRETLLWALEPEVVEAVNARHENPVYLAGIPLDPAIRATSNLAELEQCDAWLMVTPAQHMRAVLERAGGSGRPLVLCSKGIEEGSGELLHRVAKQACPGSPVGVLSGPTFAHEVAKGLPTAVTLAAEDAQLRQLLNQSSVNLPDGAPVAWLARRLGMKTIAGPVRGHAFMEEVMRTGVPRGARHYLYGSTPRTVELMTEKLLEAIQMAWLEEYRDR